MARDFDGPATGCVLDPEIQLFKNPIDDGVFDRSSEEGFDAFGAKRGGGGLPFAADKHR